MKFTNPKPVYESYSRPGGAAAPTGKPGDCKWCGRKLRRKCHTEKERTGALRPPPDNQCCGAGYTGPNDEGWYTCGECGQDHHGRYVERVVSRQPVWPAAGDYGDGHFCGLRCAYEFAVVLANAGRRIVAGAYK